MPVPEEEIRTQTGMEKGTEKTKRRWSPTSQESSPEKKPTSPTSWSETLSLRHRGKINLRCVNHPVRAPLLCRPKQSNAASSSDDGEGLQKGQGSSGLIGRSHFDHFFLGSQECWYPSPSPVLSSSGSHRPQLVLVVNQITIIIGGE